MSKRKKIGIFGSAFNPPTRGHESAILQALPFLDEIWLMPSYSHAFGKQPISYEERLSLLKLFVKNIPSEKIRISIEEKLFFEKNDVKYVYTYDLLLYLKEKYVDNDFVFVCGEDNAIPETWSKFKDSELIDLEFGKIVSKELFLTRSTQVREAIKSGNFKTIENAVFENVKDSILDKGFYR